MEGAADFARRHQVLLLHDRTNDVPVDVTFAWLPFETEALARSEMVSLGPLQIRVPRVDDLLVYKLVAGRPRDLNDVEQLLILYSNQIDFERIRSVLQEFAVAIESDAPLRALEQALSKMAT